MNKIKQVNNKKYKVSPQGTYYYSGTPDMLIKCLEGIRENNLRITLDYGNKKTNKSWGDRYNITGYISRSMGPVKKAILIYNSNSMGGGSILTDCIISIKHSNKKNGGYIYKWKWYGIIYGK